MKNFIVTSTAVVFVLMLLGQGQIMNAILNLILTGSLPGTSIAMPFWVMIALYCTAISLMVTWYAEALIAAHRDRKLASKRHMPRRRYGDI